MSPGIPDKKVTCIHQGVCGSDLWLRRQEYVHNPAPAGIFLLSKFSASDLLSCRSEPSGYTVTQSLLKGTEGGPPSHRLSPSLLDLPECSGSLVPPPLSVHILWEGRKVHPYLHPLCVVRNRKGQGFRHFCLMFTYCYGLVMYLLKTNIVQYKKLQQPTFNSPGSLLSKIYHVWRS